MDPSPNAQPEAGDVPKPRISRREAVTGRVERTRERAVAAREKHTSVALAFAVGEHDRTAAGGLLAAAVAFRLFLWVLPAALVVVGGLGFARPQSAGDEATSVGIGHYTASQIEQATAEAHRARWVALIIGIFLLYLASAALAKAVALATTLAWRRPPRKLRRPLRAVLALNVVILSTIVVDFALNWLRKNTPGIGLSALLLSLVVWVLLWWVVSKLLLPHPPEAGWMSLLPGALVFGAGLYLLHLFTLLYLGHKFTSASKLYGALGVAATILLWAYLLCRLVVASAAVDAIWHARRQVRKLAESTNEVAPAALSER